MPETKGHKEKNPSSLYRVLANRLSAIFLPHLDKILPHFMVTAQKRIKIFASKQFTSSPNKQIHLETTSILV